MLREKSRSKLMQLPTVSEAQTASSGDETDVSLAETSSVELPIGGQPKRKLKRGRKCSAKYIMTNYMQEWHNQPIFAVQFNHFCGPDDPMVFATAGGNQVTLYECLKGGGIQLLHSFADTDTEEIYYTCAWSISHDTQEPLLAAAGHRGVIRIISPCTLCCLKHYMGHGSAINDLKFHPKDPNLLLSASKDQSLRLWNIKTDACVIILGGVEGHRDEVLNCDFSCDGTQIVSCGMDHSLKIWKLDRSEMQGAIARSYAFSAKSTRTFETYCDNFPDFSTRSVHRNYVDCVKWFGKFVLSKSCENSIVCWKPGRLDQDSYGDSESGNNEVTVIHSFPLKDCDIWFIRFSLDFHQKVLAVGNQLGRIFVWDLNVEDPSLIKLSVLSHPKCTSAIRQAHLSRDGSIILASCDDGTVWRWDLRPAAT